MFNTCIHVPGARVKKVTIKRVLYLIVHGAQTMGYAQTKRGDHRPWCGDDTDAPSLGVAQVWAMLGWKIRRPPWLTPKFSIILAQEG
jgi:hypothetical protein